MWMVFDKSMIQNILQHSGLVENAVEDLCKPVEEIAFWKLSTFFHKPSTGGVCGKPY